MLRPMSCITSFENARTVPDNRTVCGMTLYALPPWICVTDRTAVSTGRTLRATMLCSAAVI
jgi:hypothetical protein